MHCSSQFIGISIEKPVVTGGIYYAIHSVKTP